ncbi:MAG TPA: DUF6597 domain-containing transcriptional factor [Candidatus Elarobacter sp.]|jgi:AraC-like DNA-binding protein
MQYRELRLGAPLDALVECAWVLETGAADLRASDQRILPDGCVELIVHCGERFLATAADGQLYRQPAAFVAGMLTRPLVVHPVAGAHSIGVRFRPGCAYRFIRTALSELTDRVVDLHDLWGRRAHALTARIAAACDDETRIEILTHELLARLADREPDAVTAFAVDALIASGGRASVAEIAVGANVTPRALQRRFTQRVGVGAKTLARVLRFQNSLRVRERCAAGRPDWAWIAAECGYADQSHLIRDYAAYASDTLASLGANEGWLSAYFTDPQRLDALFAGRR